MKTLMTFKIPPVIATFLREFQELGCVADLRLLSDRMKMSSELIQTLISEVQRMFPIVTIECEDQSEAGEWPDRLYIYIWMGPEIDGPIMGPWPNRIIRSVLGCLSKRSLRSRALNFVQGCLSHFQNRGMLSSKQQSVLYKLLKEVL